MGQASTLIVILFVLAALLALAQAASAWRRTRTTASLVFSLTQLAVSIWVITAGLEAWATTISEKLLWARLAYLSIPWVSVLWLLFSLEFIFPDERYFRRLWLPLSVVPLITQAIVASGDPGGWIWFAIHPVEESGRLSLVYDHGIWFIIFAAYSYLVLLCSAIVLLRGLLRSPFAYRGQLGGLALGMMLPWAANMAYLKGWNPWPGMDLTPFGFALSGVIYTWILFRGDLFGAAPLGYEAILNNLNDGYLVADARGRVMEASRAFCQYLELDPLEMAGRQVDEALSRRPELLGLLHAAGDAQDEIAIARTPPLLLEASARDWSSQSQSRRGRLLILHDITLRRVAEERVRSSERLYRLVVNMAPVGITLVDENGMVTFVSPPMFELVKENSSAQFIGKSPLEWIHPEERARAAQRMRLVLEERQQYGPTEYRFLRSDGSEFWGEVISTPIVDDDCRAQGMLSIIRDIDQRKVLELRLQDNLQQQTFINEVLEVLHRSHEIKAGLGQVIERIGLFTGASRVFLCHDSPDGSETSLELEWCCAGRLPRVRDAVLVRYAAIPTWKRLMEQAGMVQAVSVEGVPTGEGAREDGLQGEGAEDLQEFLSVWDTRSLLALPILGLEERQYGFLAVEDCNHMRRWSGEEISLLETVGRIISGAVARMEAEASGQRQRALAEALHDTAQAMNGTLNLDEVLDRILTNLERVVQGVAVNIAIVDEEETIRFVRWRGYTPEADEHFRSLRVKQGEMSTYTRMVESGGPVIIEDTWADRGWVTYEPMTWIRSYAAMPIRIKGRIEGFINIDSPEPDFFTHELSYSLGVFAEQAAVAIENARLYDAVHHRAEEMSILNRISMTLTAGLEMEAVLLALFDECRRVLPIDVFSVALYDEKAGQIDFPLYYNDGILQNLPPRSFETAPGVTGAVIRGRRTISLGDTLDPEVAKGYSIARLGGRPVRAYVGVPLILLDKVVGVVSMQNYNPYAYTPEQVRLLEMIATQTAIAVQNARLFDQMKQMAITDAVTGLHTRRHFTTLGTSEVERALRYNRKLSVLMVDLDHFKQVNDTYGHLTGDLVLQAVAEVCRKALRTTDIVGRWGGEEFAIVLPEADGDGASLIAERIRRMMAEHEVHSKGSIVRVTVSIGIATLENTCCKLEDLIYAADRALYLAKQNGRNRVWVLGKEK